MSAYLVEEHHIGYLAQYFAKKLNQGSEPWSTLDSVADTLGQANLDSIAARYGDAEEDPEYLKGCRRSANNDVWMSFDPIQVIKACNCLKYQSCEISNWDGSIADKILTRIRNHAIQDLPGMNSGGWGAPEPYRRAAETIGGVTFLS